MIMKWDNLGSISSTNVCGMISSSWLPTLPSIAFQRTLVQCSNLSLTNLSTDCNPNVGYDAWTSGFHYLKSKPCLFYNWKGYLCAPVLFCECMFSTLLNWHLVYGTCSQVCGQKAEKLLSGVVTVVTARKVTMKNNAGSFFYGLKYHILAGSCIF